MRIFFFGILACIAILELPGRVSLACGYPWLLLVSITGQSLVSITGLILDHVASGS
jgi:hypothetical protein